jgi:hypothetical protein
VVPGSSPGVGSVSSQVRERFVLAPSPAYLPPGVSGFAYDAPSIAPWGVVRADSEHPDRTRGTSWKLRDAMKSLLLFRDQMRLRRHEGWRLVGIDVMKTSHTAPARLSHRRR